ncbi:MAG: efflux RND transporter periplasmic adaptor subunit [Gammaproteobacteria bacterium]|nr:efflux RND transporter periplasmic adaptor subunit [Gammaproteobacteria bacterium]MBT4491926.1 efflux RND transporter periplasmic adaptor subunit [Gammaproteobacteria bacterium]
MRATYITACIIGALVILWLLSGQLGEAPEPPAQNIAEQNRRVELMAEERALTRVQVATIHASERSRVVSVRGRTRNKRSVVVMSQIDGLVVERPVERGDAVKKGQLLCEISIEDRNAALAEATAAVNQAQIEYNGSQRLSREGLQSETAIAQAKARLESAKARFERSQLDKARLNITAPFDGFVEEVQLEEGQYVVPGSACVTLVDLDPMLLTGQVSENELPMLRIGLNANARLASGQLVSGELSFVARTADEATRTYSIEIHLANTNAAIPSGVTAQIEIPVASVRAQKISPALLVLDDSGQMGVRTVDGDNSVEFSPVRIVSDEIDGIWVEGLSEVTRVITVGQQLVVAGEKVDPTHDELKLVSIKEDEASSL